MLTRNSIRGFVRPSVGPLVHWYVNTSRKVRKRMFKMHLVYLCVGVGGLGVDGDWMPLPTRPRRYCNPASLVISRDSFTHCPTPYGLFHSMVSSSSPPTTFYSLPSSPPHHHLLLLIITTLQPFPSSLLSLDLFSAPGTGHENHFPVTPSSSHTNASNMANDLKVNYPMVSQ